MIHESAVFHSKHSTVWVIVDMAHNDDRMAPKSVQNLGGMATALALPHQKKKLLRPWGSPLVQFTLFHHQPLSFFVLHAIIHYKPVSFIMKPSKVFIIHHCHYHSFTNYILLWLPSGKHTNSHGKSPSLMGRSTINGLPPGGQSAKPHASICGRDKWCEKREAQAWKLTCTTPWEK